MALRKLRGLKVGRLLVLILLIAIPAFFFILIDGLQIVTWQQYYNAMSFMNMSEGWSKFFVWFGAPFTFSLPWVAFLYVDRNRIAEAFDNMGRALRKVSIGLSLFYSVNALFVFVFFILPFGSPAIAILAAFGLIPWLIRTKTGRRLPLWITFIPGLILAVIPIFVSIGFYWNYGEVWNNIWGAWVGGATSGSLIETEGWVHVLYGFGYSLAIGAVLSGFVSFMFEAAHEVDRYQRQPKIVFYLVEFLVAGGIFTLYLLVPLGKSHETTFLVISIIAVVLSILEFFLRWRKNLSRSKNEQVPIAAYIILPLFIGVDFIRRADKFTANVGLTVALALACLIYFIIFLLAYSFAGETYSSVWSKKPAEETSVSEEE
ncbi:MAG: hypothetical protein U9O98_10365 [Asgard group archaeon]|nr:hypothetical protein [Asgard group archaeon]